MYCCSKYFGIFGLQEVTDTAMVLVLKIRTFLTWIVPSINCEDLSEDNDSIRDHSGWAIKRARDIIFKGQHELPAKESVGEESQVIYASKSDALSVISLLGEDRKQPDESYRFYVYEHVIPFFIFLHIFVENLLSPINIVREKGNILKYCLDQMSVTKELRDTGCPKKNLRCLI
jgi:hypothetical protein